MVYFNAAPHPDQRAIYYSPTETQMQPHIHKTSVMSHRLIHVSLKPFILKSLPSGSAGALQMSETCNR